MKNRQPAPNFHFSGKKRLFLFKTTSTYGMRNHRVRQTANRGMAIRSLIVFIEKQRKNSPLPIYRKESNSLHDRGNFPVTRVAAYTALERKAVSPSRSAPGNPAGTTSCSPRSSSLSVRHVDGTIVEYTTAYNGRRSRTEERLHTAREHGFFDLVESRHHGRPKGSFKLPRQRKTPARLACGRFHGIGYGNRI